LLLLVPDGGLSGWNTGRDGMADTLMIVILVESL
jgi:hypothetical protein